MLRFLLYSTLALLCSSIALASNPSLVSQLKNLDFKILFPGDPGYPNASTSFNLRFTFAPAAIAFPSTAEQVSAVLKIGAQHNHQVVARSGGHSYIANGLGGKDGAIVVDMASFNEIDIDSTSGTAEIGPGNLLVNISTALSAAGRAMPHGLCPWVGIGGHSGYGGYGFSSRMWGLLLDNIHSLDVVLANGTIGTTSESAHPDLFWALRGSSGSFGIVTSLKVQTFPEPPSATAFVYNWTLNASEAANMVSAYQDFVKTDIPSEFGTYIILLRGPSKGLVSVLLAGSWYAPEDKLNSTFAPFFQKVPAPSATVLLPGTYKDSVDFWGFGAGAPVDHDTFYTKSIMVPEASPMSHSALSAFMTYLVNEGFDADSSILWVLEIELWGGTNSAINKVPLDATAFAHRSSMFTIQFYLSATGGPPFPLSGFALADGMVNSIVDNSPHDWDYGAYPNYIDDRLENWQNLYYKTHYPRLQRLKKVYDPQDILMFPKGIQEGR
ncbi:hypothetical protein GALMADRAFT_255135 [Galerina marginata CBS 339.88]|uniref:FAD-binding PCMH-type domain-containing protein n=1 Tax=Galerina marginata (strain CBS 339.88) TaxID=685588 RepID=A0A067SU00_GALM3|nr:hypothetical protein GALMADRAFT_255135 [Galerina marginata CBS 339.88]